MPTIQGRILSYLAEQPCGVDDDTITAALGLRSRQQVNQRCRRLEQFGIVIRQVVDGKIRNSLRPDAPSIRSLNRQDGPSNFERPWFWEGHVQATVARYLAWNNYRVLSEANTATKEHGKDIVAVASSGHTLWVSAKGYPVSTMKTNPRTQARHWFSHALSDLIYWHDDDLSKALALALPEQVTYRNLAKRAEWFLANIGACIYWVNKDGYLVAETYGS